MVHIANAGPKATGPIFFNVDQPVGNGPGVPRFGTLSADVQLVQVLLKVLGFYKPRFVGFSGVNDPETIEAITQFQLNHTSVKPDGRISVAQGTTFAPNATYAIVTLNRVARDETQSSWPRIHRIPAMPVPPLLFRRVEELLGAS
jgi:peptidoglycan hydrolase-like protein with peptidoglycan-binding domain